MSAVLLRIVLVVAVVVAVLAVPALGVAVSASTTFGALYGAGPDRPVPPDTPPVHDPARPTAVVVLSGNGAEVSDVLAPYEVLAVTGRFNVYTVAAERGIVPLTGGLDLVPDLTFDDLAARLGGAAADLVVVPALPADDERRLGPLTDWLRAQAAGGTQLLGVCNGTGVLAAAGLLDGRPATAHWLRLRTHEQRYPAVDWVHGRRFVDDGNIVTTAGILSGIDGALHVVTRLVGRAAAADAAAAIGYRHLGIDLPVTPAASLPDPVAIVNAGFRWDPARVGVALGDGVGEIELASVFDVHGQSLSDRTLAVGPGGVPVRSRHGLMFVPRADLAAVGPRIDRLLVPGGARDVPTPVGGPAPEYVHDRPGFAYDAVLGDLSRTTDRATAAWGGARLTRAAPPPRGVRRLARNAAGERPVNWWKSRIRWDWSEYPQASAIWSQRTGVWVVMRRQTASKRIRRAAVLGGRPTCWVNLLIRCRWLQPTSFASRPIGSAPPVVASRRHAQATSGAGSRPSWARRSR
jgi:putative intracellular protease/amidase